MKKRIKPKNIMLGIFCFCLASIIFLCVHFSKPNALLIYLIYILTVFALFSWSTKPGDILINYHDPLFGVKATGAIGFLVLFFLWNPLPKLYLDKEITVIINVKGLNGDQSFQGKGDLIFLPLNGEPSRKRIENSGIATFTRIDEGEKFKLDVDFEQYIPLSPDSIYIASSKQNINLVVKLKGIERIQGYVYYDGYPLRDVLVLAEGKSSISDSNGYYHIEVPDSNQKPIYSISFKREGYKYFTTISTPQTGNTNVSLEKK